MPVAKNGTSTIKGAIRATGADTLQGTSGADAATSDATSDDGGNTLVKQFHELLGRTGPMGTDSGGVSGVVGGGATVIEGGTPGTVTGQGQVFDLINVANSQLGYKEGSGNDTKFGSWAGGNGNPWCFPAGTMVLTPDGYSPIESIKRGSLVVNHTGGVSPVGQVCVRNVAELVSIRANGAPIIEPTSEHPFLVRKRLEDGSFSAQDWVPASEIKKGDRVALFAGAFGDKGVDPSIAYMLGRYVGDGWRTVRPNDVDEVYICCSYEESEELERRMSDAQISFRKEGVSRSCPQYNIHKTSRKGGTNNPIFIELVRKCGLGAENKHVPPEVFDWDKDAIQAFLSGYIDADGCLGGGTVRFSTKSKRLLLEVSLLMRKFGKNCNVKYVCDRGLTVLDGRDVRAGNIWSGYSTWRKSSFYEHEAPYTWVLVKEVAKKQVPTSVYNLSVDEAHTFIADGFVVHNCAYFVSWCIDQAGLQSVFSGNKKEGVAGAYRERVTGGGGTLSETAAHAGDIIIWGNASNSTHVGIVAKVMPQDGEGWSKVYTIEGNSGNAVSSRAYTPDNVRKSSAVFAFGHPNWTNPGTIGYTPPNSQSTSGSTT